MEADFQPEEDELERTDRHYPTLAGQGSSEEPVPPPAFMSPAVLSTLSMDQLVQMMMLTSQEIRKRSSEPEPDPRGTGIYRVAPGTMPIDVRQPTAPQQFQVLPQRLVDTATEVRNAWRITLTSSDPHQPLIAIHAVGDIVIGRRVQGVNPDLDLSAYDTGGTGISRVHALIRPAADQLQLSDLGSTNGTWIDGERLAAGKVISLRDGATIGFGKCHFRLAIVSRPES